MENCFDSDFASNLSLLDQRIYTSRLLGKESSLVLHGGGNTSVKIDHLLYIKGSGWNLDTIEAQGFPPVKMESLLALLEIDDLSDTDLVRFQKDAIEGEGFPAPSIEAVLHALIPFVFVDHTHADSIVTISNAPQGAQRLAELFGERWLIIPYVMPGFVLAKAIGRATHGIDWENLDGIILEKHGIFTFDDDAGVSYGKMIDAVTRAESYLANTLAPQALIALFPHACLNTSPLAVLFALPSEIDYNTSRGVLTPEHIVRTKRFPLVVHQGESIEQALEAYKHAYCQYFNRHATPDHIMLDPLPKWAVIEGFGSIALGDTPKESRIIADINEHTMQAIINAKKLGGFESLSESECFAIEYWELEQAKLKKS